MPHIEVISIAENHNTILISSIKFKDREILMKLKLGNSVYAKMDMCVYIQ